MKNLILMSILAACSFTTHAQTLDQSSLIRKGMEWLVKNQSFTKPKPRLRNDVIFKREQLYLKVLEIMTEEKAFGENASSAIKSLIHSEPEHAQNHSTLIIQTISTLEMSAEEKSALLSMLETQQPMLVKKNSVLKPKTEISISQVIKDSRKAIQRLPIPQKDKVSLFGALDVVKGILLDSIPEDDCYHTDPNCQFRHNKGIINYYSSRIQKDHNLALAVLRSGIRIQHLNREYADLLIETPLHNQKFDLDLWPMFVDVSNGDKKLALEVISVFGHDCESNSLTSGHENVF